MTITTTPECTVNLQLESRILEGWGRTMRSVADVATVSSAGQVTQAVRAAFAEDRSLVSRGAGYSYGDPALNDRGLIVDMSNMNRILSWDPQTGIMDLEPGVTIGTICECVGHDGWWPPVVPGTRGPTIGGCVAANVHGKNNWKLGPLGEHVLEIEIVRADGSLTTCTREQAESPFHAHVGGFGLLGVITRVRLQMHPSAQVLHVEEFSAPQLEDLIAILDRCEGRADYMVGWIDGYALGEELGRGLMQVAETLPPAPDRDGRRGHALPVPPVAQEQLWRLIKPMANDRVLRKVNAAQYLWGSVHNGRGRFISRTRFDFFHDFIPNWNRSFTGGTIQYQMFVPFASAGSVFRTALERAHEIDAPPFLAVLKRHRKDAFLLSEGVDGYSMSMDFHALPHRRAELHAMLTKLTGEVVLPAEGRFYLAKDSVLTRDQVTASFGEDRVAAFRELKRELDPTNVFQSDMYRRLLA